METLTPTKLLPKADTPVVAKIDDGVTVTWMVLYYDYRGHRWECTRGQPLIEWQQVVNWMYIPEEVR